jgi:hypothetical protein
MTDELSRDGDTAPLNRNERRAKEAMERRGEAFDPPQRYLTTVQAAEYLNLSESFLDKARVRGDGPAFIRIGGAVRYAVDV